MNKFSQGWNRKSSREKGETIASYIGRQLLEIVSAIIMVFSVWFLLVLLLSL